jgi:vitamin B12 transporter
VYKYLFLLTASAVPATVHAQTASEEALAEIIERQDAEGEPEPVGEEAFVQTRQPVSESVITVTANGLGTDLRNTGQSITVLDREEIETLQGADPANALARVPGLSLSRSGPVGTVTSVNVRGANADQLLVLVDGVRVADQASPSGGFDFGNLLLGTAGKIDVLRGSNSTIWGSEAVGGVVDISTRTERGMTGSVEYGARDTLFASAATGTGDDDVFFGLTSSWYETDGFSAAASGTEADGSQQFAVGSTAFVNLTPSLEAFAHANFAEGEVKIDGFSSTDFSPTDSDDTQKTTRYWGDVGLAYYGNDLTLRAAYSLSDTERSNRDGDGAETFGSDGHSERLSLRGEYRLLGGLSMAFGGDHEWTSFVTSFDNAAETEISGAYAQIGWVMGNLAAHAGARVDDHELFGSQTSFGGDLSYGFAGDWRVRASVGEGFKAPTLYQLLSFYGNEDLQPEESTSFDLGVEKGQRGSGLHLALTGFRRDSDNLIGFGFTSERPSGVYLNTAEARAQGIEAEAGIDLAPGLRLAGIYSYVEAEDRMTGLDLARRPDHFGTIYADWESSFGLGLGADLRIVGPSWDNAANTNRLAGYELLDVRASFGIGNNLELFGRVENVFDTEYQTVAGYGTAGRGVFGGIRAKM